MCFKFTCVCFLLAFFTASYTKAQPADGPNMLCGKWESVEKNIIIQVYMDGNDFKAKIIWYSDTEGKPMDYWTDRRNPNPALRSRKILGMDILRGLQYNPNNNSWENGMVYDSKHGREWNASANIDKNGQLKVRGYWHFKFIGRTMAFYRL